VKKKKSLWCRSDFPEVCGEPLVCIYLASPMWVQDHEREWCNFSQLPKTSKIYERSFREGCTYYGVSDPSN
jgi:hypothetical protein